MDQYFSSSIITKSGKVVLVLLYWVYSLLYCILGYVSFVVHHFKKMCSRTHTSKFMSSTPLNEVLQCYPKLPKHLAIVIEEENISYIDCIKLIAWCIQSGIPFISFYSCSSGINPTSLYEVLCKRCKNNLQNIKWGNSFHESVKEMAKKDINGYVWQPVIEVNLFSSRSVTESFENVLLKLCKQRTSPEQISIERVDKLFKDEIPLPDPCLAIVCSKTFSTFGFMPWQIRVTEFIHVTTHHNLQVEDFLNFLRSYAFCEQRFGK